MNAPFARTKLERYGKLLTEYGHRKAKHEQSQRGWYDENGVRQGGLIAFVRYFWSVLEPETPFVDGWPLWAMIEHLESVTYGDISRLLMNVPPGFMKSMLVNVFWPAWEWGPMKKTHFRYVTFSYSASLTERDNDRFRTLIVSEKYQRLYGPIRAHFKTELMPFEERDENGQVILRNKTTIKVINTRTGWKLASSVGGVATGERGDRIIIDDPHSVIEAESERVRTETIRWFRESISSRFNDLDTGALVIIMQRVHQDDVSGTVLGTDFNYCHLMIPWAFDPTRVLDDDDRIVKTTIGWYDPRLDDEAFAKWTADRENGAEVGEFAVNDGEPAWPERFSDAAMARTKSEAGPFAWASQYQQSPQPRGGGLFKREWWKPWISKDGSFPIFDFVVASLDVAVTEKQENNPSGFTVWGTFPLPDSPDISGIMLIDAWRKRLNLRGVQTPRLPSEIPQLGDTLMLRMQRDVAWKNRVGHLWGLVEWVAYNCRIRQVDVLLIECEKGGIVAGQEMQRLYGQERWSVELRPIHGDKYARALAVQPTFSQGKIYAPLRDWAELVIEEMEVFPKHKYDDLTDSTTQAIRYLRDVGLAQTDDEVRYEERERVTHRPQRKALYPV